MRTETESGKQQIMEATYQAMCDHGYAELTIEKIAENSELGKSAVYYHYEDKHDLMASFLDFMCSELDNRISGIEADDPEEKIDALLDLLLGTEGEEMCEFHRALTEFEVQAQRHQEFALKLQELDKRITDALEKAISESGRQNPEIYADVAVCAAEGALSRNLRRGGSEGLEEMKDNLRKALSI